MRRSGRDTVKRIVRSMGGNRTSGAARKCGITPGLFVISHGPGERSMRSVVAPHLARLPRWRIPHLLGALALVVSVGGPVVAARAQEEPLPPPEAVLPPMVVEAPPALSSSSEILIPGKSFELRPQ